jgi:hypothetical protein
MCTKLTKNANYICTKLTGCDAPWKWWNWLLLLAVYETEKRLLAQHPPGKLAGSTTAHTTTIQINPLADDVPILVLYCSQVTWLYSLKGGVKILDINKSKGRAVLDKSNNFFFFRNLLISTIITSPNRTEFVYYPRLRDTQLYSGNSTKYEFFPLNPQKLHLFRGSSCQANTCSDNPWRDNYITTFYIIGVRRKRGGGGGRRMSIQKMLRKRIPLHPSWNYVIFAWINR